ncbi:MAG: hypothetical protein COB59_03555 [Rhodospirillaceae bacterium]|nr:MAG: hypothetical protein COB59_03555 [Rhodospirillaceae bacterium]
MSFSFKALSQSAIAKTGALIVLAMTVSSCYLPVKFDAEIEVNRAGYYTMLFDGYLVDLTLFNKLASGKMTPAEEKEKVAIIKTDLLRDSKTKEFKYFGKGHFKVNWKGEGDLLDAKMVTFIRTSEVIFQLKYVANSGLIVFETKSISKDNRKRIVQMGLNMEGQIRFKTDMPIKDHNATYTKKDPKDKRFTWLVWDVKSVLQARPRALFIIE